MARRYIYTHAVHKKKLKGENFYQTIQQINRERDK